MAIATLHPHQPIDHRQASRIGVVAIVGAVAVVAIFGKLAATTATTWYPTLTKPDWTPPDWVFGPLWLTLYAMMAVAASIVWLSRDGGDDICCPLGAFGIQLALKLVWSILFFGLRSPLLGFLDMGLLWVAVGVTVSQFFLVSRVAGWLMVPYWIWITFAGALNASIVLLSR